MRKNWVLLTFFLIGMLIIFSPSSEAYCNITNSSGSFTLVDDTYVNTDSTLVANETCSISDSGASGVIIVNASNIILDCNGTNLVGTSSGRGIYQDSKNNVTIKNCNITDYDYGIYLKSSSNNNLSNNKANLNDFYGFFIYSSSNNTITNNTANSNSGIFGYGFRIYSGSDNNQLTNNTANWNEYGFMLYSSSNNNLTNNIANWNDERGFCARESSNNTQLTNNTANWNEYGFYIHTSSNTTLTNNTMNNNEYEFIVFGTQDSHYNNSIDTSNTVNSKPIYYKLGVQDQVYDSSTGAGFFACVFCNNVTVKDLVLANNSHGILFWKTDNSIVQNITAKTNYYGIRLDSSYKNNISDNTVNSNDYGIRLESSSDNNITDNIANSNSGFNGYGFYMHSSHNNTLSNNTANWNERGFFPESSSNNNLTNNTANWNADSGFYMDGSNNNRLINNTAISNEDYGFYLESSSNNTLKNNKINISGTQYGLYFDALTDLQNDIDRTNKVNGKEVLVMANDNISATISDFDGLFNPEVRVTNYGIINLYKCVNKIIQNATVGNNSKYGIYLFDSDNNTLTNNTAISNEDYGFYLESSFNNNLTNNTANSNADYGFYIDCSASNQLTNNTAYSNNYGFYLYFSLSNILTNNIAISNAQYGVYIVFMSDSNNITYNRFCYNGQALYNDSATNTIYNNTFCVNPISPANNTWFSSVSTFVFNASNPIFTTSCQLYIDGTYSALNSSVSNNVLSTISSTPSQGSHTWYVYCNDSVSSNWGNSSLWYFGVKQSDGSACSASEHCLGGYCVHGYCRSVATYCGDGYCDSGEGCSSCSSDCGSCSSGGDGDGTAPVTKLPSKTQFWSMITPGAAQVMKVENPDIGLKQIEIIVESKATGVSIKVEKLESKPAEIVHEVDGKVYSYFKITHDNIQDKLEKAIIEFQVNKSWINSNNIDSDTVALNRYTTEWENLPTEKVSHDESYIYYKAVTTAFSVFGIIGEREAEKTACPYGCCVNETNYTDKPCPEFSECKRNECVALPKPQCPACPEPTNWTECVNERQWRTSHRCGPETNYTCQEFTEERGCGMPTAPPIL